MAAVLRSVNLGLHSLHHRKAPLHQDAGDVCKASDFPQRAALLDGIRPACYGQPMCTPWNRQAGLIVLLSLTLLASTRGTVVVWDNPGTGSFEEPTNWVGGMIPQAGENILLNNGGTAQVNSSATVSEVMISNDSTLAILAGNLTVFEGSLIYLGQTGVGNFSVGNSAVAATGDFSAGAGIASHGFVTLDGGLLSTFRFYAGFYGNATVSLIQGAALESTTGHVGTFAESFGRVTLSESSWIASSGGMPVEITVGVAGTGEVEASQSQISAKYLILGSGAGSSGNLSARGGGITVEEVGSSGWGRLTLENQAILHSQRGDIGLLMNSAGVMNIQNSLWTVTEEVVVGAYGNGTIQIFSQGSLVSNNGTLGYQSTDMGTVSVTGGSLALTDTLTVGLNGSALLSITNGGQVNSLWSQLGGNVASNGTAILDQGSWITNQTLTIGSFATGSVSATNNSTLSAEVIQMGRQEGVMALLTVSDSIVSTGSIVAGSSEAAIEFSGGRLNLRDGPAVLDSLLLDGFAADKATLGSGGLTVDTQGGNTQINQGLTGSGGLTKVGTGRLRLNLANSYSGGTALWGGVLEISGSSAVGAGNVVLGSAELRAWPDATLAGDLNGGI